MPTAPGTGFLSFNKRPPRLHITGDTPTFDPLILSALRAENYTITYHALTPTTPLKTYTTTIKSLHNDLALGEHYALLAFGAAASVVLQIAQKPLPRLAALVAYYPTKLPPPGTRFPEQTVMVCHVAGAEGGAGAGGGGLGGVKSYVYEGAEEGFAESDVEAYDEVAAGLAWSRTLGAVRKGFGIEVDLEEVWEGCVQHRFGGNKSAEAAMGDMVPQPYVNNVPVATGGIGRRDLYRFYADFFLPSHPPSLALKLVSRTMGVDRVVDEMVISFRHTQAMPWILPGVPPTNKSVRVAVVSVVCVRGGKLVSEHMYWDQASVLVQVGLLDPAVVPKALRQRGVEELPVLGAESAEKVLSRESVLSNDLIPEW